MKQKVKQNKIYPVETEYTILFTYYFDLNNKQ